MRFAHPEALWLLLALPWLALLLAWGARRGRRRVAAALGPRMAARLSGRRSPGVRALGLAAVLLALAALILGAARPQRGSHYATAKAAGGPRASAR